MQRVWANRAQGPALPCKEQFEACYGDIDCQNVLACTQSCGLDAAGAACTNACMANAPTASKTTFLDFHSCVFCTSCYASCQPYCNGLEKGGT